MLIASQIESLLFLSIKPLSVKKLAHMTGGSVSDVEQAIGKLIIEYNTAKRGIRIIENGSEYQMTTAPEHAELVADFVEEDLHGELTRPQLETLTVIAYRGPITKSELEQVRGVHCGLILRNLMMRGLIQTEEDPTKLQMVYTVTMDFLRTLGIASVKELPEYDALHAAETIDRLLEKP
ncbi:MAG: SMC-Scp complex subunit ScpB [bacterium]|nr:SMC-Scp complex subunit ScpB [bacterium]